jgi:hypothetical protein
LKTYGGNEGLALLFELALDERGGGNGQFHGLTPFTPKEKAPDTLFVGSWVGLRAGLDPVRSSHRFP